MIALDDIAKDNYDIQKITYDENGLIIYLNGNNFILNIDFGLVSSYCLFDEGCRIKFYNSIEEIQVYRMNKFYGIPIFKNDKSKFSNWLSSESYGFSDNLEYYTIITANNIIEIACPFSPKIINEKVK